MGSAVLTAAADLLLVPGDRGEPVGGEFATSPDSPTCRTTALLVRVRPGDEEPG